MLWIKSSIIWVNIISKKSQVQKTRANKGFIKPNEIKLIPSSLKESSPHFSLKMITF